MTWRVSQELAIWGDGTTRTNQNGVLKIAEDQATESINGAKIKRSRKLTEKGGTIQIRAAEEKEREDQC